MSFFHFLVALSYLFICAVAINQNALKVAFVGDLSVGVKRDSVPGGQGEKFR